MNTWPNQSDCATFYGNPDPRHEGVPFRLWENENIIKIMPPWRMVLAWSPKDQVKSLRIHKKCANSLSTVLQDIFDAYERSQAKIEAAGLHLYGGAYNFRLKRGGTTLSMHSYGCAIDLDPEHNGFGAEHGTMPKDVVALFRAQGWVWGGTWSKPDWMHFQAAIV